MDLDETLKNQKPGDWVVLDSSMTRILASSRIASDALDQAEKASPKESEHSVLMMVPYLDTVRTWR